MNLLFDHQVDVHPPEQTYNLKLGFTSSHAGSTPRDRQSCVDYGAAKVSSPASIQGCWVTGLDQHLPQASVGQELSTYPMGPRLAIPVNVSQFDQI
jgi:hypothetical protein